MVTNLIWDDRYNIGVESIDKEHKKLFSVMNKLLQYKDHVKKNQWAFEEGIKYFKEHALKHFTDEEKYMASIGYVNFETHRRAHDSFRKKTLPELERELKRSRYSAESIDHFLGVCAGWLFGHTLTEDRAITGKTTSRWLNLLPEEEQNAMKQIIVRLINETFNLDTHVVSDCYGGEKFGKGIYYRLLYANKKNEQWEIILVFEERLLLKTSNDVMGTTSDKFNTLMMNTVRYISQQFMNCIIECMPSMDGCELKEETLLNYELLQKVFEDRKPQFSLLFNTGEGYFAYCAFAPHLVSGSLGTVIRVENAMTKIEEYLQKDTIQKKKILLVDDSNFARQAMEKLLGKDYEIMSANSGLSAIRCITLNKPDLVLLDYDMPVCSGSQVLEMIRAEKDFASIPVIFLTGKMDKETVEKVIALKPEGYLLKTLQPLDIKKKIDNFFEK